MAGVVLLGEVPSISGVQIGLLVDTAILPAGDPEDQRPVVVMAVADAMIRAIRMATCAGAKRCGVPLPRSEVPGLSNAGWFSGGANILCELWTPGSAGSAGSLDNQALAGRDARFL
jgi:hypothetical protein